jgi:uncharacterized protein YchJ
MKNSKIVVLVFAILSLGCREENAATPQIAVTSFWAAMARSDKDAVLKTQAYYQKGMTSEFIITPQNIEWLYLDSISTVYESQTRARVYYQVVFKKNDQAAPTRYKTGTMTIKKGKNWKVGRVVGADAGGQ